MKRLILTAGVYLLWTSAAVAQTVAPTDTNSTVLSAVLAAVLAALPGIALGGWALFKAYAAKSAATWDDEAVAFVEKIAAGVVAKSAAPIAGVDH